MKASFDLVSEPWIPCMTATGEPIELGLLDTLARAHELREVVDPSPLVTASLHRLLLAILHRNFGPRNYDAWKQLWRAGRFDASVLSDYFEQWRHRFDLFDEERPFYQTPGMPEAMLRPASKLLPEAASGNNPALFDHTVDEAAAPLTAGEAARLVVVQQDWSLGGLMSAETGKTSGKSAVLTDGAAFVLRGGSLAETLALNMVRYDPEQQLPSPATADDAPAWEHEKPASATIRVPSGYLDHLTWQSRRLWLKPECDGGRIAVRQAIIGDGVRRPDGLYLQDPMLAYVPREKATGDQAPWQAWRFGEGEAVWRDRLALLGSLLAGRQRPLVVTEKAGLVREGTLPPAAVYELDALGLGSSKAKVFLWRHERQPLPLRYLCDELLVEHLSICLQNTEAAHQALRGATFVLAKHMLTMGTREPDKGMAGDLMASLGASARYWAVLEPRFRQLVVDLAAAQGEARDRLEAEWALVVARAARDAFSLVERAVAPSARNLRAISEARRSLAIGLSKVTKPYEEVTPAHAE